MMRGCTGHCAEKSTLLTVFFSLSNVTQRDMMNPLGPQFVFSALLTDTLVAPLFFCVSDREAQSMF